MIKKLCIILLSVCTVAACDGAAIQPAADDASFAPKKGQWQVSMILGSSQMFNNNTENYLLPTYWNGQNYSFPNVGLGNTSGHQSSDPATYLQLGDLNSNNLDQYHRYTGKILPDRPLGCQPDVQHEHRCNPQKGLYRGRQDGYRYADSGSSIYGRQNQKQLVG